MHMSIIFDIIENFFVTCHKDVNFNFLVVRGRGVGGWYAWIITMTSCFILKGNAALADSHVYR